MTDLKRLERDAFRRFYEDGVFDIFIGSMLLVFFVSTSMWEVLGDGAASYVGMLVVAPVVTVPLFMYRRRLLRSRLGSFQPGPARRRRISGTRWILLGSVVVGIVAFGITAMVHGGGASADLMDVLVPVLWFVNAVVVFGAMAYFLDVPRFAVYGLLLGLIMPLLIWPDVLWGIDVEAWLLFGIAGLAIIGFGLVKLRRFLRQYPAPEAG
jgi:hypothetical protein